MVVPGPVVRCSRGLDTASTLRAVAANGTAPEEDEMATSIVWKSDDATVDGRADVVDDPALTGEMGGRSAPTPNTGADPVPTFEH